MDRKRWRKEEMKKILYGNQEEIKKERYEERKKWRKEEIKRGRD